MSFASGYTEYALIPLGAAGGGAQAYRLELTLRLAVEWNERSDITDEALAARMIAALNRHAGGRRTFSGTPVTVAWSSRLTRSAPQAGSPNQMPSVAAVQSGRALGLSIIPDWFFEGLAERGHRPEALTMVAEGRNGTWGRSVFRESSFTDPSGRRARRAHREALQASMAHEGGHGLGLHDDRRRTGSTMFFRALTQREQRVIDQRYSDADLARVLRNVFDGPGRERPPWLAEAAATAR